MKSDPANRERAVWKAALAPTPDCIPIEQLGESLSGAASEHLAHCPRCQAEMALWHEFQAPAREEDGAAPAWIGEELRRRAAATPAPQTAWWRRPLALPAYRLAGALSLVLVVAGGLAIFSSRSHTGYTPEAANDGEFRSQAVQVSGPVGDLDTAPAEFRWQSVSGASSYRVEVMEVDRHSLWKADTAETRLAVPATVRAAMVPGKTLLWEVTAKSASGGALASSGIQKFKVKAHKNIGGEL